MPLLKRKFKSNFSHNNVVRLVRGGKDYFDTLEHLIDNAKTTLHFQTYIFDADENDELTLESAGILFLLAGTTLRVRFTVADFDPPNAGLINSITAGSHFSMQRVF